MKFQSCLYGAVVLCSSTLFVADAGVRDQFLPAAWPRAPLSPVKVPKQLNSNEILSDATSEGFRPDTMGRNGLISKVPNVPDSHDPSSVSPLLPTEHRLPRSANIASHHDHDSSRIVWHKVGAFFVMTVVGIVGCGAPYYLKEQRRTQLLMPYVNAFACGAFLGLAFFHLLPEALYVSEAERVGFDVGQSWYNLTFLSSFAGFFLVFFCEKILLVIIVAIKPVDVVLHHHHQQHGSSDGCRSSTDQCEHVRKSMCHRKSFDATCVGNNMCHEKRTLCSSDHSTALSPVALFACLSLSVHSVFEGLIVGMFNDTVTIWVATLSIIGHKWAAGFALAVNCINKRVMKSVALIYLSIFVLSSPIGVLAGIFVSQGNNAIIGVINGVSLGTILYTGCEQLFDEFKGTGKMMKEIVKFSLTLLGAGVVFSLMMLHLAKGSHNHGHTD